MRECARIQALDDASAVLEQSRAALELAPPTAARCFAEAGLAADAELERAAADRAARDRKCAAAKRTLAAKVPALTKTSFAGQVNAGVIRMRDALMSSMRRTVTRGGPTAEEEAFVQCVTWVAQDADDLTRGIYQMNHGGYAHEWVELGRFHAPQEGVLAGVAGPGEACRTWVRGKLGSSVLGPIESYLDAAEAADAACGR